MDRLLEFPDFAQESHADDEAAHWPLLDGDDLFRAKEASLARMRAIRETLEVLRAEVLRAERWDDHLNRLLRKYQPH